MSFIDRLRDSLWSDDKRRRRAEKDAAALNAFILERRRHANAEMERRGHDVPDPVDLIPANWRELPKSWRRMLYAETWATVGANIAYFNDLARQPEWVQDPLPLEEFQPTITAASGWCAPLADGEEYVPFTKELREHLKTV